MHDLQTGFGSQKYGKQKLRDTLNKLSVFEIGDSSLASQGLSISEWRNNPRGLFESQSGKRVQNDVVTLGDYTQNDTSPWEVPALIG